MKILLKALVALVAFGGIALATNTMTVQVSGTIASSISLAVPSPITGWAMGQGLNKQDVSGLAVTTNAPWHIFAQTAKGVPEASNDYYGHFWSPTAYAARLGSFVGRHGPGFLKNALMVNAGTDVLLSDDPVPLASGISVGTTQVPFTLKQRVVMADPAADNYRVVIEFTASN
ncbi:Uncharacterised protein [uncultured archaeon]|nr:Uncharacterised protein [uncultured archaeon]